jgi:hypothetical protein
MRLGQQPELKLCEKPTGASQWRVNLEPVVASPQTPGIDLFMKGPDLGAGEQDLEYSIPLKQH